jgi:hypothetical protein
MNDILYGDYKAVRCVRCGQRTAVQREEYGKVFVICS